MVPSKSTMKCELLSLSLFFCQAIVPSYVPSAVCTTTYLYSAIVPLWCRTGPRHSAMSNQSVMTFRAGSLRFDTRRQPVCTEPARPSSSRLLRSGRVGDGLQRPGFAHLRHASPPPSYVDRRAPRARGGARRVGAVFCGPRVTAGSGAGDVDLAGGPG